MTEITKLEQAGYRFRLRIDYDCPNNPPPAAAALLSQLAAKRDEALQHLALRLLTGEGGLFELPDIPGRDEITELSLQILNEASGGKDWERIQKAALVAGYFLINHPNAGKLCRLYKRQYKLPS